MEEKPKLRFKEPPAQVETQGPPIVNRVAQQLSTDPSVRYDGKGGVLFRLYLKHMLLTILTLGIYKFWAGVETKKFHHLHTRFNDGRFDYHATGGRRLRAFVMAMACLLILGGIMYLAAVSLLPMFRDNSTALGFEAYIIALYGFGLLTWFLIPVIKVGKRRFNLAYTSWNNIRFNFNGRMGELYGLYIRDGILLGLTLGVYYPWHEVNVKAFMTEGSRLGNRSFGYRGQGGELILIHMLGGFLSYITLGIYFAWWRAAVFRFHIENTYFMGKRFMCTLSGWDYIRAWVGGFFIVLFTLGFGFPWAVTRYKRILCDSIVCAGVIPVQNIRSVYDEDSGLAEALGEAGETISSIGEMFG